MSSDIIFKVQDSLKTKISDFNYKNWFKNLEWNYEGPDNVTISVPSKFVRDWLSDNYVELIKFEFFRLTEKEHTILFKVERKMNRTMDLFKQSEATQSESKDTEKRLLPKIKKQTAEPSSNLIKHMGFNPRYQFDSYVVGNSNQLVHAACRAVATQPAKSYNPLFIYGGVGLGKTHLLNAIGLQVLKNFGNWRIIYVTGERFTNEVISAIRYGKTFEFRQKYRDNCDMLLIDDIQFIAGKERTMEEFFHTFNALYEARKQIILTSDKLPKEIPNLEERLKSRFSWGLMADIQRPDFETRIAILRKKAEEDNIHIPDDVCEYIAANVKDNVRDLEGSLIRISAFASLAKLPVTLDLTKEVLRKIITETKPVLCVENIQSKVAEFYNLKISDLKSKRRHRNLAVPRHIAMYLCKTYLASSFPELGSKFGGKDHTTVMHAVSKIRNCLTNDVTIKTDVEELEKILGI
ncbi:MAG: chromosomal replication initiator protein DnaA [bacterium]|nr:chromosomal replication initiator protein DnaA [bacterium]MBU1916605.1 chromosomal replication initiator protein DnaA [bacterium]